MGPTKKGARRRRRSVSQKPTHVHEVVRTWTLYSASASRVSSSSSSSSVVRHAVYLMMRSLVLLGASLTFCQRSALLGACPAAGASFKKTIRKRGGGDRGAVGSAAVCTRSVRCFALVITKEGCESGAPRKQADFSRQGWRGGCAFRGGAELLAADSPVLS